MPTEREIKKLWSTLKTRGHVLTTATKPALAAWRSAFQDVHIRHVTDAIDLWRSDYLAAVQRDGAASEAAAMYGYRFPQPHELVTYIDTENLRRPPAPDETEWYPPSGCAQIMEFDVQTQQYVDVTAVRWSTFWRIYHGQRKHLEAACVSAWLDHRDGAMRRCYDRLVINPWTIKRWPPPPFLSTEPLGVDRPCGMRCAINGSRFGLADDDTLADLRDQIANRPPAICLY